MTLPKYYDLLQKNALNLFTNELVEFNKPTLIQPTFHLDY